MSKTPSPKGSKTSVESEVQIDEDVRPEFIYGGPFIPETKNDGFFNMKIPINIVQQGTYKRSLPHIQLKERLPVIITQLIDYHRREAAQIKSQCGGTDEDLRKAIESLSKLKSDVATNKQFEPLQVDSPNAQLWNTWISEANPPYFFTDIYVFTENYVYRRINEAFELTTNMKTYDPYTCQKRENLALYTEMMCLIADKLGPMCEIGEDKDKRRLDFQTLLKICLWTNKVDLTLPVLPEMPPDPFKMITEYKNFYVVDESKKVADQVCNKAEALVRNIEAAEGSFKAKCSCTRLSGQPVEKKELAEGEVPEELPQIPCPAKMTLPTCVIFDIVCNNAGYELFADLCLAYFLVKQEIVKKVRFHVKNCGWYLSEATMKDFRYLIDTLMKIEFFKEMPPPPPPPPPKKGAPPPPPPPEGTPEPEPPPPLTSVKLKALAAEWNEFLQNGTFMVMDEDYWTWPHVYKDMKKYDPHLYRKLQFAVAIMFKGDLNYRKLVGDINVSPWAPFQPALQGFMPAPIIVVRSIKSEVICGTGKGKCDVLNKLNAKWMEQGNYGMIQMCPKAEAFKVSDKPCPMFATGECTGAVCPVRTDL